MQRRYHTRNSMDHRFRLISINSDLLVIDPQLQNVMAAHGQGRLIKGLSHIKPHFSSFKKVLDRLVSLESRRNRNSSCCYTRIYPFQEGPEHYQWHLCISKTEICVWNGVRFMEKHHSGEPRVCTKRHAGSGEYRCHRTTGTAWGN